MSICMTGKIKELRTECVHLSQCVIIVGIYLFKVNNGYTRTVSKICLKLTVKTPERRNCCFSSVFATLN